MTTDRADLHTLTGAYVLDALADEERRSFEAHLGDCDACTDEVAELRSAAARLSETAAQPPPSGLRERILAEAGRTPQEGATGAGSPNVVEARSGTDARWALRLTAAAAAVMAIAVAGLSYTVADLTGRLDELETITAQEQQTRAQLTDLLAAPDVDVVTAETPDGATGRVVASATRGEAVFVAAGLASAPAEHTYQLWLIDDAGAASAGVFDPDAEGRATQVMAGDIADAVAIGVTVEPAGGSTQPTSDPVMAFDIS